MWKTCLLDNTMNTVAFVSNWLLGPSLPEFFFNVFFSMKDNAD